MESTLERSRRDSETAEGVVCGGGGCWGSFSVTWTAVCVLGGTVGNVFLTAVIKMCLTNAHR